MKTLEHLLFDGRSIKALSGMQWATPEEGESFYAGKLSPLEAYQRVPWVRRCVDLRAGALASLPFIFVSGDHEVDHPLSSYLPNLLWLTETSMCLYGAAYWLRVRRNGFRFLAPQSIQPQYDSRKGLVGFIRNVGARQVNLSADDIVCFFEPGVDVEVGPGKPLAQAALESARVALNAILYASEFFQRGAIPAVILSVSGVTSAEELQRLEAWWKKLLRGVQKAWETVALRADVEPRVVGVVPGKDLAMSELLSQARQQIAVAFGIPQTLLEDAANYATAAEHRLSFYEETIIPRMRWYESEINRQVLSGQGISLRFQPDGLEIFQQREAQKAQSLVVLVQAGIMTVEEARQQMGLETPGTPEAGQEVAQREAVRAELKRWQAKTQRHGKDVPFTSEIIPPHLRDLVSLALENAPDGGIWGFLKQQPPARDEAERRLQRELERVLGDHQAAAIEAVRTGQVDVLIAALSPALQAAISTEMTRIAYEEVLRQALEVGIAFDPAVVNAAALEWAQQYTFDLVKGVSDTTRNLLQRAISQYISTPGMTEEQLEALIAPAFGPVRAQMIAVTETTRAYSQASNLYQRLLAEMGFETVRVWRTRHDERVCPVCGPLENRPEVDWPEDLRSGPPAHVNCRCWTVLEYRRGRR